MEKQATLPDKLHNQPASLISAAFARWPDMRRYADTATVEQVYDAQRDEWREVVMVTVKP